MSINTFTSSESAFNPLNTECPCCLNKFEKTGQFAITAHEYQGEYVHQHKFDKACFDQWASIKSECPLDRQSIEHTALIEQSADGSQRVLEYPYIVPLAPQQEEEVEEAEEENLPEEPEMIPIDALAPPPTSCMQRLGGIVESIGNVAMGVLVTGALILPQAGVLYLLNHS